MEGRVNSYNDLPLMLNITDVMGILGVSRAFAYNIFHSQGFPRTLIGKRCLVKKDSFFDWLDKHESVVV